MRKGTKNRSSSSAFTLHFNKADDEQLEISYNELSRKANDNSQQEGRGLANDNSQRQSTQTNQENNSDNEDRSSVTSEESDQVFVSKSNQNSKESTPSRDSVVKEYWSKISKRGSSTDSDLSLADKSQDEGWYKNIKGKLTKTLEERKSVSKGLIKDDRNKSLINDDLDPERTPTDSSDDRISLKLSPAVEAAEVEENSDLFADYINNELQRAKCEIFTSDSTAKPSKTSSTEFFVNEPKTTDVTMSLSTLLAKRCASIEIAEPKISETDSSISNEYSKHISSKLSQVKVSEINQVVVFVKTYWNQVIFRIIVAFLALLFAPIPSWISGFIFGAAVSGYVVYFLLKPGKPKEPFVIPDFSHLPPSNIPVSEIDDEHVIYKGWMNELPHEMTYNPETYHVNLTHSLYIRLDGSYLRCSYPQNNIPKRAMFNERRHDMQFVHQHHYDITGCSVELLPVGLARKRLWSKKYPICIKIPNTKQSPLSNQSKDVTDYHLTTKAMASNRKESPSRQRFVPRINESNEVVLYLFSRTDREKDLWYTRFKKASRIKLLKSHSPSSSPNIAAIESSSIDNTSSLESKRTKSIDLATLQLSEMSELDSFTDLSMTKQQKFELYMSHLLASQHSLLFSSGSKNKKDDSKGSKSSTATGSMAWLNALIGRVFYDFLTEDAWGRLVADKIQKKLSKIKLPVFLGELIVKDINLGASLPKLHRASEPIVDQRGLWIDIDLSYNGSFQMTLETKLNILKTKVGPEDLSLSEVLKEGDTVDQVLRSPVYNSEEEDSAESSSDDDLPMPEIHVSPTTDDSSTQLAGGSTGKKILRLVDRFAQSSYFQQAAKNKYIQKYVKDIAETPLVLTVEVQWLTGTIALNIPPMPTDRLWYGFRTNPHLSIVARPKLGQHAVTFTHVTDWIEKKLVLEFQKILVMPNMDDLIIPIMQCDSELPKV